MIPLKSIARITHDPDIAAEVMLDFGDYIEEELFWPGSQNVQGVNYPGAIGVGRFPRGNRELQFGWTRIIKCSTPHQARLLCAAMHAKAPWDRKADLLVEWDDGSAVRILSAVLGNLEGRNLTEHKKHWAIISYDFTGSDLEVVSSEAFADSNWINRTETWAAWSDKFGKVI